MRLVEGQLIHRRYRLDKRLAQGGMGEVWRGEDMEINRTVAIKAMRADLTVDDSKIRRLRAEARNSANLAHPNIAALFEYYEDNGIGYLIMEYVPSPSLSEIYKKRGALPATELLPILIQTARGLFVAHSHGIIHRDVKPANIMVSDTGEVKITDFGVSYSTDQGQITQDGMVVGTAQYISPEQAQGEQATPQSDIYSLGVVAYEGLCGHRPFTGKTPVDIAAAHVNEPVPPLPDSVDWQLSEFIMSMLAKNPADRPENALVISRTLAKIERRLLDREAEEVSGEFARYSDSPERMPTGRIPTGRGLFGNRDVHDNPEPRIVRSAKHYPRFIYTADVTSHTVSSSTPHSSPQTMPHMTNAPQTTNVDAENSENAANAAQATHATHAKEGAR